MKYSCLFLLGTMAAMPVSAQNNSNAEPNTSGYKYAVKVYNNFGYSEQQTVTSTAKISSATTTFLKPSVAFNWKTRKGSTMEVELLSFGLNKQDDKMTAGNVTTDGRVFTTSDVSLRYEYIRDLAKNKDWKLRPSLGIGINPYFHMAKATPYTTVAYPMTDVVYGARVFVTPRLNYDVSKRLFLDLNVPFNMMDLNYHYQRALSPVTQKDAATTVMEYQTVPLNFSVRLGLGLRL